jgi:hypothetical protein
MKQDITNKCEHDFVPLNVSGVGGLSLGWGFFVILTSRDGGAICRKCGVKR